MEFIMDGRKKIFLIYEDLVNIFSSRISWCGKKIRLDTFL